MTVNESVLKLSTSAGKQVLFINGIKVVVGLIMNETSFLLQWTTTNLYLKIKIAVPMKWISGYRHFAKHDKLSLTPETHIKVG